ncbi:MAG: hypothetical protein JOZ23_15585, partial [Mycobacterium sp.]|nr:hypothetical protein [Mycobacterium sp.]
MDLALGVAVAGPVARVALVESGAHQVIDESVIDLAEDPIAKLTETVVGTNQLLADQAHRLIGTRLCWSDQRRAGQLRQALDDSGVQNVAVLSESQAAEELRGTSSLPLEVTDDPDFALARGAAMAADAATMAMPAGDSTMLAPAATMAAPAPDATMAAPEADATMADFSVPAGDATMAAAAAPLTEAGMAAGDMTTDVPAATGSAPQLAYSMEEYNPELLPMEYEEGDDEDEPEAAAPPVGRALLIGSSVGGILVAGCAALAVAVAIDVRPTAASQPQQPVPIQHKAVPGNFVPALAPRNAPVSPPIQAPPAPVPAPDVPQVVPGPGPQSGGGVPGVAPPAPAAP